MTFNCLVKRQEQDPKLLWGCYCCSMIEVDPSPCNNAMRDSQDHIRVPVILLSYNYDMVADPPKVSPFLSKSAVDLEPFTPSEVFAVSCLHQLLEMTPEEER